MKRPFLVAALLSLTATCLSVYAKAYIIVTAGILVLSGIAVFLRRRKVPCFFALVFISFPVMVLRTKECSKSMCYQGHLSDKTYTAQVTGRVTSVSRKSNNYAIQIGNAAIRPDNWGDEVRGGIIIYSDEEFCNPCDFIDVKVWLKDFDTGTNEGEFNARAYYNSLGINYQASLTDVISVESENYNYISYIYKLSDSIKNTYEKVFSHKNAGLMESIVLGDKSQLDTEIKNLYQNNGIAHILAISSLHVTLVGMLVYRFLKKRLNVVCSAFVSAGILLSYLCMTGNSVSASRAVIMLLVFIAADVLGRTSDGANTLGLAVVILLWVNPYSILNTGFQMSFLAMAGIIFLRPVLYNEDNILVFIKRPEEKELSLLGLMAVKVLDGFITGLSVQIATLPVMLVTSGQFAVISLILNILVIPLMSVVMISGIFTGLAGMVSLDAAYLFAGASELTLDFFEWLCRMSSHFKKAVIVTGCPDSTQIIIYYLVLTVWCGMYFCDFGNFLNYAGEKCLLNRLQVVLAVMFVLSASQLHYRIDDGLKISMLDVGQGDAVVVHYRNGSQRMNVMFDGGSISENKVGQYRIYSYLKYTGVRRLDYIFVSHSDKDHVSGIYELIELCDNTFEIGTIVLPDISGGKGDASMDELALTAKEAGIDVKYAIEGDSVRAGGTAGGVDIAGRTGRDTGGVDIAGKAGGNAGGVDIAGKEGGNAGKTETGLEITCLHPCEGYSYESANDYSAIYMICFQDFKMLMAGDAESKAEKCLMEDCLSQNMELSSGLKVGNILENVNVLKVGHHGSKGSSSEEFLKILRPEIALISCGKDNSYGHPHEETLLRLKKVDSAVYRTDELGQIRIYCDKAGDVRCERGTEK